jgi:hypothetical protein
VNFREDLNDLLKKHTETSQDYYDIVDYLMQCLEALDSGINRNEAWLPQKDGSFSVRLEFPVNKIRVTDGH